MTPSSPFLKITDVVKYLSLHELTIYRMAKNGTIRGAFKVGNKWRFNKEVMDREFDKQTVTNVEGKLI